MKRRKPPPVEPPARLRQYDPAEWLPLVDDAGYVPDNHRNRRDGRPVGTPHCSLDLWREQEALTAWSWARVKWQAEFGWPGGLDSIDLLQEAVEVRRRISAGES